MSLPFTPRLPPFDHQQRVLDEHGLTAVYALFHEQGTGKSKTTIDNAALLACNDLIDAILVIAPSGVHRNWVTDELPKHWPDDAPEIDSLWWSTPGSKTKKGKARWNEFKVPGQGFQLLAMSYDQMQTKTGKKAAWDFLRTRRCLYVLDESARIKTPSAKRSRTALRSSVYAPYRRILTGTPVANSPFDVYAQVRFLDAEFWIRELGIGSYTAFKNRFAQFVTMETKGGQRYNKLIAYRDLDVLEACLKKISDRVLKEDVLDLPPKLYATRTHELTPPQTRLYNSVRDEFMAILDSGELITAEMAIVRLLRLQQICSGFISNEDGDPIPIIEMKKNPRVNLLKELLIDTPHPSIVWARFQYDIDAAAEASRMAGRRPVVYDGRTSEADRAAALDAMHNGEADDFIANPAAAGEGLTIVEAKSTYYYSNSFNLTHRLQSEDRNHRIGQTSSVLYTDLVAEDSIDLYILNALKTKRDVASTVLGDEIKQWLMSL